MDENDRQIEEFFRAMDRLRRAWHSVTPCQGLSKSQFGTLMVIRHYTQQALRRGEAESISLSALAAAMNQSAPALSQRVRLLEDMGYVQRVPDSRDRRISGVQLTGDGLRVLQISRRRFNSIMHRSIEELGPEASGQLITLLSRLAMAFELSVEQHNTEEAEII